MLLNITEPSSFYSTDSPIHIFDELGNMFYVHPNRQRKITFNLPIGEYKTENNLKKVGFVPYVKNNHNFDFKKVIGLRLIRKKNKNKATITPYKKEIVMDKKVRYKDGTSFNIDEYQPCKTFLIGHEIAHLKVGGNQYNFDGTIKFDAEKKCDEISETMMLSNGYNPSQIRICKQLLLSSPHRMECSQYYPTKNNFRR